MHLGQIIKKYRKENNYSMDYFAKKSGLSKAYISLLEKNQHPKTGKPISPSVQCIKQAADGMGMNFDELFNMLDGTITIASQSNVSPSPSRSEPQEDQKRLLEHYDKLNSTGKEKVIEYTEDLTSNPKYTKDTALKDA